MLVNAAGPWATQVAGAIQPAIPIPDVDLVQGTHIVLPFAVTAGIYYVESPTDGRAVFVMPWHGATLIGTTETPYRGDAGCKCSRCRRKRNICWPSRGTISRPSDTSTREHITQRFAGLRVLPAATQAAFDRSRETIFTTDRETYSRACSASTAANSPAGAQPRPTSWSASARSLPAAAQASRRRTN